MKLESMIGHISAISPNCILQVDIQTKNKPASFNTKATYNLIGCKILQICVCIIQVRVSPDDMIFY
jgi:hypothetical protein